MKKKLQLSELFLRNQKKPGAYADGLNNLYFQITKTGSKSWLFRYMIDGKRRAMGLGPYPAIGLKLAREKAADLYRQIKEHPEQDPIEKRNQNRAAAKQEQKKQFPLNGVLNNILKPIIMDGKTRNMPSNGAIL